MSQLSERSGEYDSTKSLADTFLSSCDIDKEPVKAELRDIKELWEKLNNVVSRAETFDAIFRRLGVFNEDLANLRHAVGRWENRLGAHDAFGDAAKDLKLLERVKTMLLICRVFVN